MTIKQTMSTAINGDPSSVKAVVNEATDGKKAVPTELVLKKSDDSTFEQVSRANPMPIELTGSNALKGAVQNVTTSGTRIQLPSYACREVTIIAKKANTGSIYVGGIDVSATVYGAELSGNDSITLAISNTNLIYIDSSVSGEGISYVAV